MRGLLAALGAITSAVACVPTEAPPSPPIEGYAVMFLVSVPDSAAEPVAVSGPILPGSTSSAVLVSPTDSKLFAVGLRSEMLSSLHPDVAIERLEALQIEVQPDAEVFADRCRELGVRAEDGALSFVLGERGEAHQLTNGDWTPAETPLEFSRLALRVPTKACSSARVILRPYGRQSPFFGDQPTVNGQPLGSRELESIVEIDSDQLYLLTDNAVLHVEGGETYVDDGLSFWAGALTPPPPEPGGRWRLEAFARIPPSIDRPIEGLILAGSITIPDQRDHGIGIFRVAIDAMGRFGAPESLLVHVAEETSLDGLAMAADGSYVAIGGDVVVTATSATAPPILREGLALDAASVAYDASARPAMLMGTRRGGVWVGNLFEQPGLVLEESGSVYFARVPIFVRGVPHVGIDIPPMRRRVETGWEPVLFPLPEALSGCADTERICGRLQPGAPQIETLASFEDERGRFAVTWGTCLGYAVVEPRPIEACVVGLAIPGLELSRADKPGIDDLVVRGNRALLSGDGGLLIEAALEE